MLIFTHCMYDRACDSFNRRPRVDLVWIWAKTPLMLAARIFGIALQIFFWHDWVQSRSQMAFYR